MAKWAKYISFVVCALLLHRIYNILHRKINKYPPGPDGLPFIGSLFQYRTEKFIFYLKKHYSAGVVMIYIFGKPIIYVIDFKLFRKIFSVQLYREPAVQIDYEKNKMIKPSFTELNNDKWSKRRQLVHECFTSLINSNYIDIVMKDLLKNKLFPIIDNFAINNKEYQCREDLKWISFAFLFGVMFGVNSNIPSKNDIKYQHFLENIAKQFAQLRKAILFSMIPSEYLRKYFQEKYEIGKAMINYRGFMRDWYQERKPINDKNTYFYKMLQYVKKEQLLEEEVISNSSSLIIAGLHVTVATIESSVYFAAKYPNIQERVYNELKQVFKDENSNNDSYIFEMKQINKLHLFRAYIHEIIRFGKVTQSTLPRHIVDDNSTKIGDYNIPKHSVIFGRTECINFNEEYWKYPEEFYIEHFLDENKFKKPKYFVTFGYGRRDCVGQSLAMKELYSILSSLLFRYKFIIPQNKNQSFEIPKNWFKMNVPQLSVRVIKR